MSGEEPEQGAPAVDSISADHSATASLLGYLHQTRWGLLELVRNIASAPDLTLTMEMHDDISWVDGATPIELKQLKLHAKTIGTLGDASVDLWRTIRVWLDAPRPGDPFGPELVLVTNAYATQGSAAALLGSKDRNEVRALELLEAAARKSKNERTRVARDKFLGLSPADRTGLLGRIYVQDRSLDAAGVEQEVEDLLLAGAPIEHFQSYVEQVWGWWNQETVRLLRGARTAFSVGEVRRQLATIRERFSADNLPTTVGEEEVGISTVDHADRTYVYQLRWIGVRPRVLERAVIDYERAFMQATRWLDRNLVTPSELERFALELTSEWEREFDYRCDELPRDTTDEDKRRVGRKLLHDLGNSALTIRPRFNDQFFTRGQQHSLADKGSVGWHPEFATHVQELLLEANQRATA